MEILSAIAAVDVKGYVKPPQNMQYSNISD